MSISIRPALLADVPLLAQWAKAMAFETEQKILADEDIFPGVRRAIEQEGLAHYFIAELSDRPAGCLMLTYEWSDWRNGLWWWIQSVYIDPECRRQGVYRALYAHVQALAENDADVQGIRLYVEKENRTAQQTYLSLGMHDSHYRVFEQTTRKRQESI
jgi:ribosomal protein S18 acetylase RimI-like enzyme